MSFKLPSPLGQNSVSSLKTLFEDKEYYYNFILPYSYLINNKIFFSDLYNNHALYGVIDNDFNTIVPKQEFLTNIMLTNNKQQIMLDFAADAFLGLKKYLENACTLGKVDRHGIFGNIKAYKSYSDPNKLVNSIKIIVASDFKQMITSEVENNYRIRDHVTFNKEFLLFLKNKILNNNSISKSEIILSNFFISYSNGLTVDCADEKECDQDKIKYEKYFTDKDFLGFKDTCKRFGFYIDANMPWRLTLDVNSPAMYKTGNHNGYLFLRNIANTEDLFNKRYNRVYLEELQHLKDFFYDSYDLFLKDNLYYEDDYKNLAGNKIKNRKLFKREVLNKTQYLSSFDDEYWLRMFAFIRNYETKKGLTQQQFDNIVREGNRYIKVKMNNEALKYVNNFFKNNKNIDFYLTRGLNSANVSLADVATMPQIYF